MDALSCANLENKCKTLIETGKKSTTIELVGDISIYWRYHFCVKNGDVIKMLLDIAERFLDTEFYNYNGYTYLLHMYNGKLYLLKLWLCNFSSEKSFFVNLYDEVPDIKLLEYRSNIIEVEGNFINELDDLLKNKEKELFLMPILCNDVTDILKYNFLELQKYKESLYSYGYCHKGNTFSLFKSSELKIYLIINFRGCLSSDFTSYLELDDMEFKAKHDNLKSNLVEILIQNEKNESNIKAFMLFSYEKYVYKKILEEKSNLEECSNILLIYNVFLYKSSDSKLYLIKANGNLFSEGNKYLKVDNMIDFLKFEKESIDQVKVSKESINQVKVFEESGLYLWLKTFHQEIYAKNFVDKGIENIDYMKLYIGESDETLEEEIELSFFMLLAHIVMFNKKVKELKSN